MFIFGAFKDLCIHTKIFNRLNPIYTLPPTPYKLNNDEIVYVKKFQKVSRYTDALKKENKIEKTNQKVKLNVLK